MSKGPSRLRIFGQISAAILAMAGIGAGPGLAQAQAQAQSKEKAAAGAAQAPFLAANAARSARSGGGMHATSFPGMGPPWSALAVGGRTGGHGKQNRHGSWRNSRVRCRPGKR